MAYPIKLLESDYEPIVWFFNPNIFPEKEYEIRRDELIKYCEKNKIKYIVETYEPQEWYDYIKGLENEPEKGKRCDKCFEFRLFRAAEKASELNLNIFTTTLTVSPHKVSKNVFAVAQKAALKYNIEFLEQDFKKQDGFKKTMEIAKENDFYRQQYCGCEYSIRH